MIKTLKKWYWKLGLANRKFAGSGDYWQKVYTTGGNSGPGSYGRLAGFKAGFINDFIARNGVRRVIDMGCGDGNQLSLLKVDEYHGFDVSPAIIANNKSRFSGDASRNFYKLDDGFDEQVKKIGPADLALSLDVIFHLVEQPVFETYLNRLFNASMQHVIIYSTNYNSRQVFHEKNRRFTGWVAQHRKDWELKEQVKNPYPFDPQSPDDTSECDFFVFRKK